MEGIVNQLKASWQVMGEKARRAFKRYAVYTAVANVVLVVALIVLRVMIVLGYRPFQLDVVQSFYFYIWIALIDVVFLIVTLIILSSAYKAIKRDYFARAFPGEFCVEQNHWSKRDAFLLYAGLVGLVGFIPNVVTIVLELTDFPDLDLTNIITGVVWIGIAIWAVPRCCARYLAPGPRLGDGSAAAPAASNTTDGHEQ